MICPKCGAEIVTGEVVCASCGYKLPQVQNIPTDGDRQNAHPQSKPNPPLTSSGTVTQRQPTAPIPPLKTAQTSTAPQQKPSQTGPIPQPKLSQTGPIPQPKLSQTGPIPQPKLSQTGPIPQPKLSQTGPIPQPKLSQTGQIPQVSLLSHTGEMQRIAKRTDGGQSAKQPPMQTLKSGIKDIIHNKKLMLTLGAALLLLVTFTLIIALPREKLRYTRSGTTIRWYYNEAENKTYISADGKLAPYTFSGQFGGYSGSLDGTVRAAKSDGSALHLITSKKTVKIAEYADSYTMSQNGNSVAYTDEAGRLMLYSSGSTTVVSEETIFDYKFSPDGKIMIYAYEDGENDIVLCKYENGKSVHIGDGVMPVSVSNDGEYIYAYNTGGALYCYSDNWREKIAAEVMPYFFTSTDGNELGFFTSASVAYVSVKGGDAKKLFRSAIEHNGYVYPVTDAHYDASWRIVSNAYTTCVETGMVSFADAYLSQAGSIFYIDENYNGISAVSDPMAGTERGALIYGDNIVYISESGELYRLGMSDHAGGKLISEDVTAYAASADGAYIYFIDGQDDVWVNNGKKSQKLAESGHALYRMNGGIMLILTDFSFDKGGTLYYSENGGSRHRIADGVKSVSAGVRSAEYSRTESGAYTVYSSTNGKKYELIFEDR